MTILEILEAERRLCQRMIVVAEATRDAIMTNDLDVLTPLAREMEGMAARVAVLEHDRRTAVAELTGDADATLASLLPFVAEPQRESLASVSTDLRGVLAALRTRNDLNAGLIRRAAVVSEQSVRLLRAAVPATYGSTGAASAPAVLAGGRRAWNC